MKYVNIVPAAVVWEIPHNILLTRFTFVMSTIKKKIYIIYIVYMRNINELNKLLSTNEDENKYWKQKQQQTQRGLRIIRPPLNSLIYQVCYKLLIKQHIIWLGGPPGVGKTSCSKRFQDYGFMAMDGEDSWNKNKDNCRLSGLKKITKKVYEELNTSFVFGACYGKYLLNAPEYVIPILILPDFDVYERRWKKRNPNDTQNHNGRYRECQEIAKGHKNILVLHQPQDECIDVTIYRICELIINKL